MHIAKLMEILRSRAPDHHILWEQISCVLVGVTVTLILHPLAIGGKIGTFLHVERQSCAAIGCSEHSRTLPGMSATHQRSARSPPLEKWWWVGVILYQVSDE